MGVCCTSNLFVSLQKIEHGHGLLDGVLKPSILKSSREWVNLFIKIGRYFDSGLLDAG